MGISVSHVLLFLAGDPQLNFMELRPGKYVGPKEDRTWNTDASITGKDLD